MSGVEANGAGGDLVVAEMSIGYEGIIRGCLQRMDRGFLVGAVETDAVHICIVIDTAQREAVGSGLENGCISLDTFQNFCSRKSGEITMVDIHLSFEENARVEEIADLQKQMQEELKSPLGNCVVNIIVKKE
jgi:hypothetical protein